MVEEARGPAVLPWTQCSCAAPATRAAPDPHGRAWHRVATHRAVATQPAIRPAAEPTGNLDPTTSLDSGRLLDRINRTGTTIVMATHDDEIVDQLRKRVVELNNGEVVRDQSRGVYGAQR